MRNIKHQVFFEDTLKFFLSLYGHKLPVTSIDISSDNALLVSGSADKNIKLWGLDFGDCHRSIFAHGDAVTSVAFVPRTHLFFSASKDKTIKVRGRAGGCSTVCVRDHMAYKAPICLAPLCAHPPSPFSLFITLHACLSWSPELGRRPI